jgi:nucleoside-diphosphate-sugar epimerase
MTQIIVSGATGFIGSHLVEKLIDRDYEVLSLGRKPFNRLSGVVQKKLFQGKYINLDMDSVALLPELHAKITNKLDNALERKFFHLAWGGKEKLSCLDVEAQMKNVTRTVNAMAAAKAMGCSTFFHLGSMEEEFAEEYLNLNYKTNTEYNRHVIYAVAKLAAHKAVQIKSKELDLDYIYVNHSHVMGPHDSKDSILQVTLENIIKGNDMSFSSGEQLWDVISVHDCVDGFIDIIKKGLPGSKYWVGSGFPNTLKFYIERIFELYPPEGQYAFGSLAYNDIKLPESTFDISRISEDTGFTPKQSFEDAVTELYNHLRERIA